MTTREPIELAERFKVSRKTLLVDKLMTHFIKIGGISIIIAVFGIFLFILMEIMPIFSGAKITEDKVIALGNSHFEHLAIDEWGELPLLIAKDGKLTYQPIAADQAPFELQPQFPAGFEPQQHFFDARNNVIIYASAQGAIAIGELKWNALFSSDATRTIEPSVQMSAKYPMGEPGDTFLHLGYADAESKRVAIAIVKRAGKTFIPSITLKQKRSLMGGGKIVIDSRADLSVLIPESALDLLVPKTGDAAIIQGESGTLYYLFLSNAEWQLRQTFKPFADSQLGLIQLLNGDSSLIVTDTNGRNRIFSLQRDAETNQRIFKQTKAFKDLPAAANTINISKRNKAFLVTGADFASLRYGTTTDIRWEHSVGYTVRSAQIGAKYDRLALLSDDGNLHIYTLDDPHPEASFKAFFGEIWYEGQSEPNWSWQSTGGSDDFEPKLSLVPLIWGSLKGTFYALFFAVPIALLAAIYTSQFLKPEIKRIVKPIMEIMASLPSVVLGFLAALWLAPIVDTRVPSVLLCVLAIPLSAILIGYVYMHLPPQIRMRIKPGYEFSIYIPVLIVVSFIAWNLGPALERALFTVTDPTTGNQIADFRLWWPTVTGSPYTQRNSLVVGFMMGFAVIPIIFTIAEDALSNVPENLKSASLALGASRWQTAVRVILPTASAGVFSALMIGLGRAVGETMIVVMATGNTPIMDLNIFSGMRTLSANIAVELPEAPHGGTLYRTLFLGAMILFLMTFCINTLAEVLRQRLRERYKTVD
jgi:phosphate transport system permease protein